MYETLLNGFKTLKRYCKTTFFLTKKIDDGKKTSLDNKSLCKIQILLLKILKC